MFVVEGRRGVKPHSVGRQRCCCSRRHSRSYWRAGRTRPSQQNILPSSRRTPSVNPNPRRGLLLCYNKCIYIIYHVVRHAVKKIRYYAFVRLASHNIPETAYRISDIKLPSSEENFQCHMAPVDVISDFWSIESKTRRPNIGFSGSRNLIK